MKTTKRLAHKECPCAICAERVRKEKAQQDAAIWSKVPPIVMNREEAERTRQDTPRRIIIREK